MLRTEGRIYCHDGPLAGQAAIVDAPLGRYYPSYFLAIMDEGPEPLIVTLDVDPSVLDSVSREDWQVYRLVADKPGPDGEPGYFHEGPAVAPQGLSLS